jgi:hypothetical protein
VLGAQGDIWDAQKDMAAAFYGSILSVALLLLIRKLPQPPESIQAEDLTVAGEFGDGQSVEQPS